MISSTDEFRGDYLLTGCLRASVVQLARNRYLGPLPWKGAVFLFIFSE